MSAEVNPSLINCTPWKWSCENFLCVHFATPVSPQPQKYMRSCCSPCWKNVFFRSQAGRGVQGAWESVFNDLRRWDRLQWNFWRLHGASSRKAVQQWGLCFYLLLIFFTFCHADWLLSFVTWQPIHSESSAMRWASSWKDLSVRKVLKLFSAHGF